VPATDALAHRGERSGLLDELTRPFAATGPRARPRPTTLRARPSPKARPLLLDGAGTNASFELKGSRARIG